MERIIQLPEPYKNRSLIDIKEELWKPIKGYEGHYMISNEGRIKSVARIMHCKDSKNQSVHELILKQFVNRGGYLTVSLSMNCKCKTRCVHRLVGTHFLNNPCGFSDLNHLDGNKLNCRASNLEFTTRKLNMQHAVANGLRKYKKGGPSTRYKIKPSDVISIFKSKESTIKLAREYNVTCSAIQRIRNGRSYKTFLNGLTQ